MKNNIGALTRPSARNNKKPIFSTGLLTIMLIVSFIFTLKIYEPTKNILVTGGILVYPFTFLIVAYIAKYYNFKEAKKSIFTSAGLFAIFILLMAICLIPAANNTTTVYNSVVQYVFASNYFKVADVHIFYPVMGQFCGILIAFLTSHLLYASIYNAIHKSTADQVAMGLGVFIAGIIDRVVFIPILLLENLLNGSNTLDFLVKCITSEFIATILFMVIIIIIYSIITFIKDNKKKKSEA